MNECPHLNLRFTKAAEETFYRCRECSTKFIIDWQAITIKPFEIQAMYREPVERQEGEKGR